MSTWIKKILPGFSLSLIVAIVAKFLGTLVPSLGAATIAILLGILLGNTFFKQPALQTGTKFSESRLLEYSVVMLGFTVTFQTIQKMGINGLIFVLLMMTIVIISAYLIGRRLGFSEKMSLMFAGGNAVCGSSAIGAIAPAIDADDEEKGQTITLVNLLGTVMMLTLPFLGMAIFGSNLLANSALLGGTLQSVAQVVAGSSLINSETVQFAMLFKITRIILLVVVVYIFEQKVKKSTGIIKQKQSEFKLPIPWYVLLFLIFCLLNSTINLPEFFNTTAHFLSSWFETIALAAIGLRLDFRKFIKEGPRFLLYGVSVGAVQTVTAIILIILLRIR
ncbi:putative sulfate exporter family transporter [Lactobacillus sp. YT155]|uniref:YeiH family protein n=1 Tax=Lactobacillus sp. YT155 TaxID=3060955 RepID=UPI00265D7A04|nr:putative sulfate exporter family transporter [Lactobacillus sp. YT155]MDO1604516.1 putative sulfate exporter family transporter [Lactobacillus sp. YT155]